MRPDVDLGLFADVPDSRRRIMRAIRGKETLPERCVRSVLHKAGYRFRKNVTGLAGRPDIAFSARRKLVFVHGCFWHAHAGCRNAAIPRTRATYWGAKLARNVERDRENMIALEAIGWAAEVVWECELSNIDVVLARLKAFIGPVSVSKAKKKNQESDG